MCFFHIPIPNPLAYNTSDICRLVPRFFVFHVHIQHDPKQPKKALCFRIKSPCNTPNPRFLPCRSAVFRHCRWCGDFGGWLQCQFGITHDPGGHVFKGLYGVLPGSAIEAHIDMFSPLILVLVYLTLSRWRAAFFLKKISCWISWLRFVYERFVDLKKKVLHHFLIFLRIPFITEDHIHPAGFLVFQCTNDGRCDILRIESNTPGCIFVGLGTRMDDTMAASCKKNNTGKLQES